MPPAPTALTIAGFDPSAGAGVTADLAVFAAHNLFGISAITAITIQNTLGVQRVEPIDPAILTQTLKALEADLPPAGIKIGMLADEPQAAAVIAYLKGLERKKIVVLDPVLVSSSGANLLSEQGRELMQRELLPLVHVITPNAAELATLTNLPCQTDDEIRAAARALALQYPALSILCTGGDRLKPDDILLHQGIFTTLPGDHIETTATHGTGCALSSALLCNLIHGIPMAEAAAKAKLYVTQAMMRATPRGGGKGPLNLLWNRKT
jgi:hydroxymethylpyrimidine/phosphomethylpyrimidine kinase